MESTAWILVGACIMVLGTGLAAALSIGKATAKAVESAARQPEAADKIRNILILGAGLIEATAVYALIVALLLIFTK